MGPETRLGGPSLRDFCPECCSDIIPYTVSGRLLLTKTSHIAKKPISTQPFSLLFRPSLPISRMIASLLQATPFLCGLKILTSIIGHVQIDLLTLYFIG